MVEGGATSPFGTEWVLRNCLVGGKPFFVVVVVVVVGGGRSAVLLDKILEKDMGLEAFGSSFTLV